MAPNDGRKSPMSTAALSTNISRIAAQFLIARAERQTGSRMAAYEIVAKNVGTSAEWLRKFINGSEAKEPKWSVGWSLIDHCNRVLCTRVEQEMDQERSQILALKRDIDAVASSLNRVVEIAEGAQALAASSSENET